jgi:hypothetical protein
MRESVRDMLAREAAEAEARAAAELAGEVAPTRGQRGRRPSADPAQVYAVRIPVSRLRELRAVADDLDVPPSTLIRQWVLEQLDELAAVERNDPASSHAGRVSPSQLRLGPSRRKVFASNQEEVRLHA